MVQGQKASYKGVKASHKGVNASYEGVKASHKGQKASHKGQNASYKGANASHKGVNASYKGVTQYFSLLICNFAVRDEQYFLQRYMEACLSHPYQRVVESAVGDDGYCILGTL